MTRGGTARLFVAVELPPAVREALGAWGRSAAREIVSARAHVSGGPTRPTTRLATRRGGPPLRLLEPEALHLTMCFLGNHSVGEIEAIEAAVDSCEGPMGEVSLGAPLWLPPRRPQTLAVEVHHDGRLAELQAELVEALAGACGFESERRRFRPHITVARMRAGAAPGERQLPATPALTFAPAALVLYRSWLSPAGASYEALASRSL